MKYRHIKTGEVVEADKATPWGGRGPVLWFINMSAEGDTWQETLTDKNFHATYEPLEEGGQDE